MIDELIIFSSLDKLPSNFLKGFAFDGVDLICGDDGYKKFRARTNRLIHPGGDGAYLTINKTHEKITIGTDYPGHYKLYVYQDGAFWAISNSLIKLAEFASNSGHSVNIDYAQLSSFHIYPRRFGDQLCSLSTAVREIRTLPARVQIEISNGSHGQTLEFFTVDEVQSFEVVPPDYESQLWRFLSVWIGRFVTILNSDLNIKVDVTGGLDSRTVLSLILAAAKLTGSDALKRVLFYSNSTHKADYSVSCQLADSQNFVVRKKIYREYHIDDYRVDTDIAYSMWKNFFPGTYMPVIFPSVRRDSNFVWIAGNGGEAHRPDYSFDSLESLIDNGKQFITNPEHFEEIRETTLSDMEKLRFGLEKDLNPVLGHYRNFRDRYHHGRRALICNSITPLSSVLLRFANNVASPEIFQSGRLLTDIITNCVPELFDIPFDDPRKKFRATGRASDDAIARIFAEAPTDGTVYSGSSQSLNPGKFIRRHAINMLQADFDASLPIVRELEIFSSQYIETAASYLSQAADSSNFAKTRNGSPAAFVTFAARLMEVARS